VIANAETTVNTIDPGNLATIAPKLWLGTDADLFEIQITSPATFSAQITNATNVLALFAADGTAIAASRGGGAGNALTGASLSPGFYFIGESQTGGTSDTFGSTTFGVPRNSANLPLFDFTTDGIKSPIAQADQKLATDPFIAWTINNGSLLIGPNTFTAGGANITMTGADFAITPEPAAATLLGAAMCGVLLRRRRSA